MGRVTPYQQRQLESSLVGTPGVDNSGTILAGALGSAQNKLAAAGNAVNYAATRQMEMLGNFAMANFEQEMRYAKNVKQQAIAAQQKYNADTEVALTGTRLASEMMRLESRIKKDYLEDPATGVEEYDKRATELRDTIANSMGSQAARLAILKDFGTKYDTARSRINDWSIERESIVGYNKLNQSAVEVRGTLEGVPIGDIKAARQYLDDWQDTNNKAILMYYGKGAADFIVNTKTTAMKGMLSKWSEQQPGIIQQMQESGELHNLVYQETAKDLLAQDRTNVNVQQAQIAEQNEKRHLEDSHAVEFIKEDINKYADTDVSRSVNGIYKLYDLLEKQKQLPIEQRDLPYIKYLNSTIQSALATKRSISNAMLSQLREDARYNQLVDVSEQALQAKLKQLEKDEKEKIYDTDEAVKTRTDLFLRIEDVKTKINSANQADIAGTSGISAKTLRQIQSDIMTAFNDRKMRETDMRSLTEKVVEISSFLYDTNKDKNNFFGMFLDKNVTGPSDNLLRGLGVSKTGPDGKPTLEYLQIKDAVDKKLKEILKKENVPTNTIMSAPTVNAKWAEAQFEVLKDFIGAQRVIERAPVKVNEPKQREVFNVNQARQQINNQLRGMVTVQESANTPKPKKGSRSGLVAPPPPVSPINMDVNAKRQMLQMYRAQVQQLEEELGGGE